MSDDAAPSGGLPSSPQPTGGDTSPSSAPSSPKGGEAPESVPALDDVSALGQDNFDDFGAIAPSVLGREAAEEQAEEPPVSQPVGREAAEAPPQQPIPEPAASPSVEGARGPQTLDELIQVMGDKESDIIAAVAQSHFALSPAQIEELETDAVAAVPKLLAQTHIRAVGTALNYIRNLVPGMIQRQVLEMAKAAEADRSFFKMWPSLSAAKHGGDIVAIARAMRAQNPAMAPDLLLRQVGAAVMAMHGIAPPAARQNGSVVFRPATPGVVRTSAPVEENPVEGLGRDYE